MNKDKVLLLLEQLTDVEHKIKELSDQKKLLTKEIVGLIEVKKEGQKTYNFDNKKLIIRANIKRKLNIPFLLKDYNKFDSLLRDCFPLQPKLNKAAYKQMLIINPLLMSQYVTESKTTYSASIKESKKPKGDKIE